jgi:hypothetical protein
MYSGRSVTSASRPPISAKSPRRVPDDQKPRNCQFGENKCAACNKLDRYRRHSTPYVAALALRGSVVSIEPGIQGHDSYADMNGSD